MERTRWMSGGVAVQSTKCAVCGYEYVTAPEDPEREGGRKVAKCRRCPLSEHTRPVPWSGPTPLKPPRIAVLTRDTE